MRVKKKKKNKDTTTYHRRNLDNLMLFLSDPEVKKIISATRVYLKIPSNGFCEEDQFRAIGLWYGERCKHSSKLLESGLVALQKKLQDGEINKTDFEKKRDSLLESLPENYLTNTTNLIVEENNLPISYRDSIRAYIISGSISAPAFPFFVVTRHEDRHSSDSIRSVTVQFNSKITNADLKPLQEHVNVFFARELPNAPKPIKHIGKKIMMEEMNGNVTTDNITHKEHRSSAKEIAQYIEEEFGVPTKPSQLYDVPRELERHRKKRFRKSGK